MLYTYIAKKNLMEFYEIIHVYGEKNCLTQTDFFQDEYKYVDYMPKAKSLGFFFASRKYT